MAGNAKESLTPSPTAIVIILLEVNKEQSSSPTPTLILLEENASTNNIFWMELMIVNILSLNNIA